MNTYALVKEGKVVNTIVWDGPNSAELIDFGDGVVYEEIPDASGNTPSIGWLLENGKFTPPPLTEAEVEAAKQAAIYSNIATKDSLMNDSTQKISVLQDAVDLEMATDEEKITLQAWKKYRVILSRLNADTDGDINWPEKPNP